MIASGSAGNQGSYRNDLSNSLLTIGLKRHSVACQNYYKILHDSFIQGIVVSLVKNIMFFIWSD
ncbi:hypothetical protein BK120_08800 [Paenibacillus sp. FSL A5-0031]|nr:hypothetical protein BK120_08800 [Paenibacillus sp. FSL A5-0031]